MTRRVTAELAYLTGELPGIGGVFRQSAADFVVEERALREPSGEGEYLWLCVERQNQMTTEAARRIAKMFGVGIAEVGYAGLKDKHAVTRQHFSVRLPEASKEARQARFAFTGMRLLWARRDERPLVRGDLRGNRFTLRVRQSLAEARGRIEATLERIRAAGVPNYFGYQRFGYRQNNHVLGAMLVTERWEDFVQGMLGGVREEDAGPLAEARAAYRRGEYETALRLWPRSLRDDRRVLDAVRQGRGAREAVLSLEAQQRRFLISALQSAMFNEVLDRRLRAGLFERVVAGDRVMDSAGGESFVVDAAAIAKGRGGERARLSPSGPMWGPGMALAGGEVAEWEEQALGRMGLRAADVGHFAAGAAVTELGGPGGPEDPVLGTRRPLRVWAEELSWREGQDAESGYVEFSFVLPRGAFATALLREIMKTGEL